MILDNEDLISFLVHGALSGLSQGVHTHGAQKIAQSAVDVAQLALVELQARGLIHSAMQTRNGSTTSPVQRHTGMHQFVGSPFAPSASTDFSNESRAPRSQAPPPVMPGQRSMATTPFQNPSKVFEGAPLANPLSVDGPLLPMRPKREPDEEDLAPNPPLPPNASPEETET